MIRLDSIKGRTIVFFLLLISIYFVINLISLLIYIDSKKHEDLETRLSITLNESYEYVRENQDKTDLNFLYNIPYMIAMLLNSGARQIEFFFSDEKYQPDSNEIVVSRQMENGKYFNLKSSDSEVKKYIINTAIMQLLQHSIYLIVILILSLYFLNKLLSPLNNLVKKCKNYKDGGTFALSKQHLLVEIEQIESALSILIHRLEELRKKDKEIFALATHELKTPLAIIKARVERYSDNQAYLKDDFINDINNDIKRLYLEVKSLLYFNVFDFDEKSTFSIKEAIEDSVLKVDVLLKNNHLRIKILGDDFSITARKNLFVKMLMVLLENAIIYAKIDSVIEIAIKGKTIHMKNTQGEAINLFSSKLGIKILDKISKELDFTFDIIKDSHTYEIIIYFG